MPKPRRPHLFMLSAIALALALTQPPALAKQKRHATAASVPYGQREDLMRFGAEVAVRHGFDPAWVQAALAESRFIAAVAKSIMPPPASKAKNWAAYRARFIEPIRVNAGLAFWNANEEWLRLAEERTGVPPEIIVGIVGVETLYGQHMGNFRVIDALATLAFDFPPGRRDRSAFFRDELESLFVLSAQQGINPLTVKGSYAGAIGMPQFMPSSIIQHAVDFDGDGHIDLQNSSADVIGSIANFLAHAGWQRGLTTHFDVLIPADANEQATLLGPDIVPLFSPEEFLEHGATLPAAALAIDSKLALVELLNGPAEPSYVAGTNNFYALTRYNWSSYYAMAVITLGHAVKKLRQPAPPTAEPAPMPASSPP